MCVLFSQAANTEEWWEACGQCSPCAVHPHPHDAPACPTGRQCKLCLQYKSSYELPDQLPAACGGPCAEGGHHNRLGTPRFSSRAVCPFTFFFQEVFNKHLLYSRPYYISTVGKNREDSPWSWGICILMEYLKNYNTVLGFLKCDVWDRLWAWQRLWKCHWDIGLVWERCACVESCLTIGSAVYKGWLSTSLLN